MQPSQQPDLNAGFNADAFQNLLNQWRASKDKKTRLAKSSPSPDIAVQ